MYMPVKNNDIQILCKSRNGFMRALIRRDCSHAGPCKNRAVERNEYFFDPGRLSAQSKEKRCFPSGTFCIPLYVNREFI